MQFGIEHTKLNGRSVELGCGGTWSGCYGTKCTISLELWYHHVLGW